MTNWLQKIISTPLKVASSKSRLPAKTGQNRNAVQVGGVNKKAALPNASIIYGIAASVLFVIAVFSFLSGAWITGLLIFLPLGCFVGFAVHFIKHQ